MTDMKNTDRVTGKQVLQDAVILLKDTGSFVLDLGKVLFFELKNLINERSDKADKKAAQDGKSVKAR